MLLGYRRPSLKTLLGITRAKKFARFWIHRPR
jgi:hypothetical protein